MNPLETAARYPDVSEVECPFPLFKELRAEEPVRQVPGKDHFLVSRHADIAHVLRHPEIFSSEHTYSDLATFDHLGATDAPASLLETDPPANKAKRRICSRSFTPSRMKSYEPMIEDLCDELIAGFADEGECEFVDAFARPLPIYVTCAIMGLSRDSYRLLEEWGTQEVGLVYLSEEQRELQRERSERVGAYLDQIVTERLEEPREDAISELIQDQIAQDGEFDKGSVMSDTAVLVAGGVITTAHLIASAMVLLCENPDQMARVRDDRAAIPRMLEEALRMESPVQWNPRKVTEDTEIAGVAIPAGSMVLILYASGNRDEGVFDAPEHFDVGRGNVAKHLAFGLGTHFCLGAPLARLEGKIAFEKLFDRFAEIRLVPERSDLTHLLSPNFRAPLAVGLELR